MAMGRCQRCGQGLIDGVMIGKGVFKGRALKLGWTIIYFLGITSIIFFKKRKKAMHPIDLLCEAYSEWLQEGRRRGERNILHNFRRLSEEFYNPEAEWDNSSIFLPIHSAFLIHALCIHSDPFPQVFPHKLLLLNFILKRIPKSRISLTEPLLNKLNRFFRNGPHWDLAGSALWLVCRGLQGSCDKRMALERLRESGMVELFLQEGKLDLQAEKAVGMLLYFISKNHPNRPQLISLILKHQHHFSHPESIKHVLAMLREVGVESIRGEKGLEQGLSSILVRFMGREDVALSDKMLNIELIAFTATHNPSLYSTLQVPSILNSKLSISQLPTQPFLDSLMSLAQLQVSQGGSAQLLDAACTNLSHNVVARRIFILLHQQLDQSQLMSMIGVLPAALQRLLSCPQERDNGLKLLICLKRAINRVGLSRVFWCCCRALVQQVAVYRKQVLPESSQQLVELFEQIVEQQNYHLFTI